MICTPNHDKSTGVAAGSKYVEHGGGSNVICIDLSVSYTPGKYQDGNQGEARNIDVLGYATFYHSNLLVVYRLLKTTNQKLYFVRVYTLFELNLFEV